MKALRTLLASSVTFLSAFVANAETSEDHELLGSTQAAVRETLGEPMGSLSVNDEDVLIFPTLRLTLRNGVVVKVEERPDAIVETPEERDARIAAKRAEVGSKLLEQRKYEPTLLKKSPEEQLRHWGRFKLQFPETDVDPEMERARKRLEEDLEQEHVIVKSRSQTIKPHESVTDPFYRKRRDFDSPFDPYNRVVIIAPNGNRGRYHRRPVEQEPYLIEQLPGRLPHDEVFNTPNAVAPIVVPPDQRSERAQPQNSPASNHKSSNYHHHHGSNQGAK